VGTHLTREYGVDPLEIVIVSELMSPVPHVQTFSSSGSLPELFTYADGTCRGAAELMATEGVASIPVVDRATHRVNGTHCKTCFADAAGRSSGRENGCVSSTIGIARVAENITDPAGGAFGLKRGRISAG
jgi:hypothetical protein